MRVTERTCKYYLSNGISAMKLQIMTQEQCAIIPGAVGLEGQLEAMLCAA